MRQLSSLPCGKGSCLLTADSFSYEATEIFDRPIGDTIKWGVGQIIDLFNSRAPANSPPPCRPGWPAELPRSESEAGLSRPPPSSTQLTTSVHSAFNSWWAHLSYIFLNKELSRPFSGFLMFPFSWYIVRFQLVNFTMVYYNRKQERRRNSMRRSITLCGVFSATVLRWAMLHSG